MDNRHFCAKLSASTCFWLKFALNFFPPVPKSDKIFIFVKSHLLARDRPSMFVLSRADGNKNNIMPIWWNDKHQPERCCCCCCLCCVEVNGLAIMEIIGIFPLCSSDIRRVERDDGYYGTWAQTRMKTASCEWCALCIMLSWTCRFRSTVFEMLLVLAIIIMVVRQIDFLCGLHIRLMLAAIDELKEIIFCWM
jgi:hypothetical protein